MIANFFTVAVRNFLRQRLYSFINVLGLMSGLICTLLIFLWVRDEVAKDTFHKDADKIFHVVSNLNLGDGKIATWFITPGPLADRIRDGVPDIEFMARTMDGGPQLFQYEDKNFLEHGYYADPEFFKIFSFDFVRGNGGPGKLDKSTVAISQNLAIRLFGTEDAVGKNIKAGNADVTVSGVFENPGTKSSLQFDFILPFELERERRGSGFTWGNYDYPLYLKLSEASKAESVIAAINKKTSDRKDASESLFYIQPFTDWYLHSNFENGKPAGGRVQYVKLFTVVAIFILLIACINFMNMATAKAATRMKEVGVRKVVGAQRISLIVQFMTESFLISLLSMVLAVVIVYVSLPLFNSLVEKEIVFAPFAPAMVVILLSITLVTGVMAGCYPAFVLSSFRPVSVLKGSLATSFSGSSLRKSLVIFQFSLTVIMVASALIVYRQIEFIRNTNIGYNREAVVTFFGRGSLAKNFDAFRNEALQLPGVLKMSRSSASLVQVNNQNGSVHWPGKADNDTHLFRTIVVDYDFLETMGLTLKQGRFFSRDFNDTSSFVLSQHAVDVMGLNDPIGQQINQWGVDGKVVGVVDDFHSRSLHEAIDPIVFMCKPEWSTQIFVRVEPGKTSSAIGQLQTLYKKYLPEFPFEYTFVDDDFERLYNNEKVTSALAIGFTSMAIVISGLGLLGLASYTTERKKKEISIRKTLGASVSTLVAGMSREFVILSVWATILGCPIAYYLMSKFLEGYAYHVNLSWGIFALTALVVLIVSVVTVIFQVVRAAFANPVDALRNE